MISAFGRDDYGFYKGKRGIDGRSSFLSKITKE